MIIYLLFMFGVVVVVLVVGLIMMAPEVLGIRLKAKFPMTSFLHL